MTPICLSSALPSAIVSSDPHRPGLELPYLPLLSLFFSPSTLLSRNIGVGATMDGMDAGNGCRLLTRRKAS